jgi:hypothetical protein
MKHSIHHTLDFPLAKKATLHAFESYEQRFADYNPAAEWTSDHRAEISFKAKGIKLGGVVELFDERIDLELEVPFLFRPFRNKAMSIVEEEIRRWVAKAENGELDGE